MNEEEKRIDELRASIDEIEEEIGVEMFVNMVEEEGVKEREISEKIKRCEELRKKYVEKTTELERKSPGKSSAFKKVEEDITREVKRMRNLRTKVQNEKIDGGKKVGAKVKAADAKKQVHAKEKARVVKAAATSAKRDGNEETAKIAKRKNGEGIAKIAKREKGEEIAKIAKREKGEEIAKIARRENEEKVTQIMKEENGEEIAEIAKSENEEETAQGANREKDKRIGKIAKRGNEEKEAKSGKNENDRENDTYDDEAVESNCDVGKEAKTESNERDILEHVIKPLPKHAQLGYELKNEVAAAFPLLQAQRGEPVASGLNLARIPIKDERTKKDDEMKDGTEVDDDNFRIDSGKMNGKDDNNDDEENDDCVVNENDDESDDVKNVDNANDGEDQSKDNHVEVLGSTNEEKNHMLGSTNNIDRLEATAVGFFNGKSDMHDEYIVASNETRGTFKFMHTTDVAIAEQFKILPETVAVFQPEVTRTTYEDKTHLLTKQFDTYKEIMQFVKKSSIPMVGQRFKKNLFKYTERPLVMIYYDVNYAHSHVKDTQFVRNKIVEIAQHFEDPNLRLAISNEEEFEDKIKRFGLGEGAEFNVESYSLEKRKEKLSNNQVAPVYHGQFDPEIKDSLRLNESGGALPTEYGEFVRDSRLGVPAVSVKPREGIGVYKDIATTHTLSKFFKGVMLAANNGKSPNFDKFMERLTLIELNYTSLVIVRDAFRWRGWSCSSLNLNSAVRPRTASAQLAHSSLVGGGVHGRGAQEKLNKEIKQ